ncbi:hypothetical protein OOZ19_04225 [Saccharopolyspora sp. NFXS83]|uniref:hypothetical protein n=1 Tax=Saccharopolyspora sp. NFXS83 TaxID=2993560 RepID=UPI00224A6A9A|nr:hypothetical protein [Saccharopolyspora sp. NFXS83]MCX2729435.1 hypothetical protein [Saccharopolyspora sp. NFXS83]
MNAIDNFEAADFHLVIASPEMKRLMDSTEQGPPGDLGHITAAMLRDGFAGDFRGGLARTLPVILPDATGADLPRIMLRHSAPPHSIRDVEDVDDEEFQQLLRTLLGSTTHAKPRRAPRWPAADTGSWEPPNAERAETGATVLGTAPVLSIGEHAYLVHGDVEEPSTGCTTAVLRQARALRLDEQREPVWLRQVERRHDGPDTQESFAALATEHELLGALERNHDRIPAASDLVDEGRTRTLVLNRARPSPLPGGCTQAADFATLAEHIPHPDELDSIAVQRTVQALARLCEPLAALHLHGFAHRELAPNTIIRIDDEHLALRDLGAAGRRARPGEAADEYQAPEQTRRRGGRLGPWTDVFRLAATAYHLISGLSPTTAIPLPVRRICRHAPERAATAIDAALHADPQNRPELAELATAFRM